MQESSPSSSRRSGCTGPSTSPHVRPSPGWAFGSLDDAADVGVEHTWEALLHARSMVVLASRVGGCPGPVDGVTTALRDPETLERDVAAARALGFTGKLCIHPAQVDAVRQGFAPTQEEVAWARRVVAAVEAEPAGAVSVDGAMVDKPVLDRARRILHAMPDPTPAPEGGPHDRPDAP